jgi:putative FmdB family regulatory protein
VDLGAPSDTIEGWTGEFPKFAMPLYEYKCKLCGKKFEVLQHFADKHLTVHEGCGGPVERLLSVPSFRFKGTGWYVTDYGHNGSSMPTGSSDGHNGHSESKSETKSETKTASKPPSQGASESAHAGK